MSHATASDSRPRALSLEGLMRPVDGAGLAVFRIAFGLLMCVAALRFLTSGWVERFYGEPSFFFKYWGFSWVKVAPVPVMYAIYAVIAALGLLIALGLFYRVSVALFFVLFTYTELCDVTNYLNHYYLVSLLALLMIFMPLHRTWSLDAWRRPELNTGTVPAWCLYLLRFQIGTVYVFAGLAKLSTDWLLHAQPLNLWLNARTETPIIGALFDEVWVAYAASWFGFLYDTTIVIWLSMRRTRPYAFAILVVFHVMTRVLFNIGMFPFIMVTAATVFFAPKWPRRFLRRPRPVPEPRRTAPPRWTAVHRLAAGVVVIYCAVQVLVPLRHFAYPGNVLWNEQGMRWAWKVMVREKHGSVTYYVRFPATGKQLQISPRRYLNARQEREMAGQPDLIQQLARHIARDFARRGYGSVAVHAEAVVSLNGRPARHMIDPTVDLSRADDGLGVAAWILDGPSDPPIRLGRRPSR